MNKHLLSIDDVTAEDIVRILDTAESFREVGTRVIKKVPALRGRTVVNLFYENSTRTRISFELAAKRLSADVINFSTSGSSVSKGESLKDTALTLQAMGADAIVIRHSSSGSPLTLTKWVRGSVLNAGDGTHEHPTQALLDIYTMRERQRQQYFPSVREYARLFGLTSGRVAMLPPEALIMHPGPMNRGVEIESDVADLPNSVIEEQVTNGIAVRMALLYLLLGGAGDAHPGGVSGRTGDDEEAGR